MRFSWHHWWTFEKLVIRDAWDKSKAVFLKVRSTLIVGMVALAIATYVFREFVDSKDLLKAVGSAAVVALTVFIWRIHSAVPRIYGRQSDEIGRLSALIAPRIALSYDSTSCCRDTIGNPGGIPMKYVSVAVSGPDAAAVSNVRVFLHKVERLADDGQYISIGIEGGPSLAWTRPDKPDEESHTPKDIGPGHTRLVNVFHVQPIGNTQKLILSVREQLNREINLLDRHGIYRFFVRANCSGFGGYSEIVLRITWLGSLEALKIRCEGARGDSAPDCISRV
jgi:hypothetical protein